MDFKPNQKVQTLKLNNQISSLAIAHYLKDHTHCDWKRMMDLWLNGHTTSNSDYYTHPHYYIMTITPKPRHNGGFWGGGGHSSPANYETTIQFLVDSGLVTFSKVNGFKLFTSTRKLKNLSTYGLRTICITTPPESFENYTSFEKRSN